MINAIKQAHDNFKSMSAATNQKLQDAWDSIATNHANVLKQIDQKNQQAAGDAQKRMGDIMVFLEKIKQIKATPGKDGLNGQDGKDGKAGDNGKDGSPDTGEQIVEKINQLPEDDELKIDASHIKNLPTGGPGARMHGGFRNPRIYSGSTLIAK